MPRCSLSDFSLFFFNLCFWFRWKKFPNTIVGKCGGVPLTHCWWGCTGQVLWSKIWHYLKCVSPRTCDFTSGICPESSHSVKWWMWTTLQHSLHKNVENHLDGHRQSQSPSMWWTRARILHTHWCERLPHFTVLSEQRDTCNHVHTHTEASLRGDRAALAWVQAGPAGQAEEGDTFSLRILHTFRILYQAHLSPTKNP